MTRTLIALELARVPEAAAVLARAFRDNPGVRAVMDRQPSEVRQRLFERGAKHFAIAAIRHGLASAVVENDRVVGVSLAYGPGQFPLPIRGQLEVAKGPLTTGPRMILRFARIDAYMRKKHLRRPHYYLFMIGVDPEAQGKGHGGVMLSRLNELADAANVECYLETDREENVGLYQRYGYAVTTDDVLRSLDSLRFWTMTRPKSF